MNKRRKTKILLILTRNIFEQSGASSNRWRTMVEGLVNNGIELQIIFTQGYGSVNEFKTYGWHGKIGSISYSYSIFLLQNSLWMRRISGYLLSPLLRKFSVLHTRQKIKKLKPDIIWLQPVVDVFDIYLTCVGSNTEHTHKLMIELNEYNDIGLIHSTNKLQLAISKRFSRVLLEEILPLTDLVLVMTQRLMEHYKQYTNSSKAKFLHLPMTVDLSRFNLTKEANSRYIAYCGSSSFVKDGVDIMLRSFALITKKFPEIKLKIAAFMEADGFKMLSLIEELELSEKVEYVGELTRDEIPEFIINAMLLLLPRPDSRQAQGGFPTKLGEYLSTGNPVCATTVGEIPNYLTDNENVFFAEPGSIDSFSEAMYKALSNPAKAIEVGKNGKLVAEINFNMDVQTGNLISFIEN